MPSPPAPVSSAHQATAGRDAGGVGRGRPRGARVAWKSCRVGCARAAPSDVEVPQVVCVGVRPRPRSRAPGTGASRRSSSDVDRPAVAPVRVDEALGARPPLARAVASRPSTSMPRAAGARQRRRRRGGRARTRRGADRGVLRCAAAPGPSPTRASARSRGTSQSVVELVPEPGRGRRRRARARRSALAERVVEERAAGAGEADARGAVARRRSGARAASASRQTTTTAREPMCFSSQTTRADAVVGGSTRTPRPGARAGPARPRRRGGDIVGGR